MNYKILASISAFFLIALFLPSVFAVTPYVNFQARLTDSNGVAINADTNIEFIIYDALTGGTAVFYETHNNVSVTRGLLNVVLGDKNIMTALSYADKNFFLSINVNGNGAMSPRIKVSSSTTAFRSNDANDSDLLDGNNSVYYAFPPFSRITGNFTYPQMPSDFNSNYNSRFAAWLYTQVPADFNSAYASKFDLNFMYNQIIDSNDVGRLKPHVLADVNNQYNSKFAVWLYTQVPSDFNSAYASKFDLNFMYNQIIDSNDVGRLKAQVIADMNLQYNSRFAAWLYTQVPADFNSAYVSGFDINKNVVQKGTTTEQNLDANILINNGGGAVKFVPDQNLAQIGSDPLLRGCLQIVDKNLNIGFC